MQAEKYCFQGIIMMENCNDIYRHIFTSLLILRVRRRVWLLATIVVSRETITALNPRRSTLRLTTIITSCEYKKSSIKMKICLHTCHVFLPVNFTRNEILPNPLTEILFVSSNMEFSFKNLIAKQFLSNFNTHLPIYHCL